MTVYFKYGFARSSSDFSTILHWTEEENEIVEVKKKKKIKHRYISDIFIYISRAFSRWTVISMCQRARIVTSPFFFSTRLFKFPPYPVVRILAFSSPVALTFILLRFPLSLIPIHIFRTMPTARRELEAIPRSTILRTFYYSRGSCRESRRAHLGGSSCEFRQVDNRVLR